MDPLRSYGGKPIVNNAQPFTETVDIPTLIEMSGLKEGYIAKQLDVVYSTYLKLMRDLTQMRIETFLKLAQVLRVSPDYLFSCAMLTIANQASANQVSGDQTNAEKVSESKQPASRQENH